MSDKSNMDYNSRIYIAGHEGLVGSAIVRLLKDRGFFNLVTSPFAQLDLRDQAKVNKFFFDLRPEYIFLAAAKVGGIKANNEHPADFIYDNLMIEANVMHAAFQCGAKKLLFLGSSCIYPKFCAQPIKEEYLMTGSLEPTNEPYAIAKIAGITLAQSYRRQHGCNFICAMPTNLYGPGDTFDENNSHVIPALIKKIHVAKITGEKSISLWGSGRALREFLYVDDCANALVLLMEKYNQLDPINVGSGQEVSIRDLAHFIKEIVGYKGEIRFDINNLDGTPRKLIDSSRLAQLGWGSQTGLYSGIQKTYEWFLSNQARIANESNYKNMDHFI